MTYLYRHMNDEDILYRGLLNSNVVLLFESRHHNGNGNILIYRAYLARGGHDRAVMARGGHVGHSSVSECLTN